MHGGKQVFIGSSTEQLDIAKKIASKIEELDLSVLPWWDDKAFRPGDFTLNRLIQLSRICEASVFVFAGDDETWFRRTSHPDPFLTARDNVLLEYGLFVAYGGVERSLIVAQNGIKLPSDLKGLNVLFFKKTDTHIGVAEKVKAHFEHLLEEEASRSGLQDSNIVVRTDWGLRIHRLDSQPGHNWSGTGLYEGRAGAMAWHAVETDPEYVKRTQASISGTRIANLIGDREVNSVVSFGPGMGSIDTELVGNLATQKIREYVPIDINSTFLIESARRVASQNPWIECKTAIQCDFERDISLVESVISSHCSGPLLLLMHGGTFGNLERSESASLNAFYKLMEPGDLFTFDLYCKGESYDPDNDPLANHSQWRPSVRKFFANGVRRLTSELAMSEDDAVNRLDPTTTTSHSSMNNTHTVQIKDSVTQRTLIQIKRYDYDQIYSAIAGAGFSIIEDEKVTVGPLERHVILAGK